MASVVEERMAMVLDASDATATTTDVEGALQVEGGPRAQSNNARVLKVAGAAAAAALAACALVATAVVAAREPSRSAPQASGAVELQQGGLIFTYKKDTGCSNWDLLRISTVIATSMDDCLTKCAYTAECATANFQDAPCTLGEGAAPGTCYLFRQGCMEEVNTCWTLGSVGRDSPITVKAGYGCTNWESIKLYESIEKNPVDCVKLCKSTAGCTSANFQALPNDQCTPQGEGAGEGTCYLYGGVCVEEQNACWSLAAVAQPNSPTTYKEGVGCSNWDTIQFDLSKQNTRMECASRCAATAGCVAINFQGLANWQCPAGEGAGQNSCYLFKGTCNEVPNPCWAFGYMFSEGSGTVPATTTANGGAVTTASNGGPATTASNGGSATTVGTTMAETTTTDAVSTTI